MKTTSFSPSLEQSYREARAQSLCQLTDQAKSLNKEITLLKEKLHRLKSLQAIVFLSPKDRRARIAFIRRQLNKKGHELDSTLELLENTLISPTSWSLFLRYIPQRTWPLILSTMSHLITDKTLQLMIFRISQAHHLKSLSRVLQQMENFSKKSSDT